MWELPSWIIISRFIQQTMSKKEIEDLLKKGAYGAVMEDDDASSKYVVFPVIIYFSDLRGSIYIQRYW